MHSRLPRLSLHQSSSQRRFIIPRFRFFFFVCPASAHSFAGKCRAEGSIDGEANVSECEITTHLIMMLLIAAGTESRLVLRPRVGTVPLISSPISPFFCVCVCVKV